MRSESSCSGICPCATLMRASGMSFSRCVRMALIVCTRLCTKNTCPPRSSSRSTACLTRRGEYGPTCVMIGRRSSGGVLIVEMSRTPVSVMYSVRGIGVAVSVSTSTSVRIFFSVSLCVTPKRCSSSMISSPRSLKPTSAENRRCVPIMISIAPFSRRLVISRLLLGRAEA